VSVYLSFASATLFTTGTKWRCSLTRSLILTLSSSRTWTPTQVIASLRLFQCLRSRGMLVSLGLFSGFSFAVFNIYPLVASDEILDAIAAAEAESLPV